MTKKKPTTVIEALLNREMGLSEVKTKLLDTIERLKVSANFPKLAKKHLKEFWQKEFPSAPFEEMFTFKQMAEIDVETFFKKRSVLPSKILGIIASIEKAIGKSGAKTSSKKIQAKAASSVNGTKAQKKIKFYELQYGLLIKKCEMMIELLDLAENSPELMKKELLDGLASDIKKIDKILTARHDTLSGLI
jgi:hypothetical protein